MTKIPTEYTDTDKTSRTYGIDVDEFNQDNRARFPEELSLMYMVWYHDRTGAEYFDRLSPDELYYFLYKLSGHNFYDLDEIAIRHFTRSIEVDGIESRRNQFSIHNPSFYSIKPVPSLNPTEPTYFDTSAESFFKCKHCDADWVMDEYRFLTQGMFVCSSCKVILGAFG